MMLGLGDLRRADGDDKILMVMLEDKTHKRRCLPVPAVARTYGVDSGFR
jgi:hypothetical protein